MCKIARILRIVIQTGANLAVKFLDKMGKRLCNGDFSLLSLPLVSNVKNQPELPKSLLVGGQSLDRANVLSKTI